MVILKGEVAAIEIGDKFYCLDCFPDYIDDECGKLKSENFITKKELLGNADDDDDDHRFFFCDGCRKCLGGV